MEYVYSALLLHSAGKEVNEGNVKKVLESAGAKAEDAKVKALVSALEGVNIEDVIKQSAMPMMAVAPVTGGEAKAEKKEVKEEKKEEKAAEEAASGLASLFG
ncbi:MAG: 50S ribosomal protein P1 [Candidatus Aenigmarchaeota archaeon]|nr:50S ribosomal protein P1 [Candidatus Aenigmarchaeota archaeon]